MNSEPQHPLLFERILVEKVWGGQRLVNTLNIELPFDGPLGETWELSDYPGKETKISNGDYAGKSLRDLMTDHGAAILGTSQPSADGRFPLLVKLLDSGENLSVQVHPADGDKSPTGIGKTEAWYVLDSDDEASLICGLHPNTDASQFALDAPTSKVRDYLVEQKVSAGDCVYIPAGQIHAICAGTVLVEIQQTSDVTYRLYDWDRLGLDGVPRETHLQESLEVIDFELSPSNPERRELSSPVYDSECAPLCGGEYFTMHLHRHGEQGAIIAKKNKAIILTIVSGCGELISLDGQFEPMTIKYGDTVLIPACIKGVQVNSTSEENFDFIRSTAS
ncbi:MAG: class I mannose-6-phosphate isomerase [Planctomycetes bacterium]|nr:class I mannose-6-phosphate isomerase [Planctomycetota bacterium]